MGKTYRRSRGYEDGYPADDYTSYKKRSFRDSAKRKKNQDDYEHLVYEDDDDIYERDWVGDYK